MDGEKGGVEERGGIVDFDVLIPAQRLAKIGGEVVDVTVMPTRVTIALARFADDREALEHGEMFEEVIKLISAACVKNNPKITPAFLIDNTNFHALTAFIDYVLKPIADKAKNLEAVKLG